MRERNGKNEKEREKRRERKTEERKNSNLHIPAKIKEGKKRGLVGGVGVCGGREKQNQQQPKKLVFLQQALETKVSKVSAAVASDGTRSIFLNGCGEEGKLCVLCAALWLLELLVVASTLQDDLGAAVVCW